MDQSVRKVLTALNDAGFEAYVVGGAVRDLLMRREPHDYDLTTAARPEEIRRIVAKQGWHTAAIRGERFAVTVLVVDGKVIETATFRGESYGGDSHRPERVWYADSLREDVLRRDFTVNAMAMDKDGHLYDYVNGRNDVKKKRLVTVGEPQRRFREDALRLFRACRFAGQLDFQPVKELQRAMPAAFDRVSGLSLERVVSEIDRLLVTPAAYKGLDILVRSGLGDCSCRQKVNGVYLPVPILPELSHLPQTPQSRPFHAYDAWVHTLAVVAHTPPSLTVRYSALFHDVAKGLPGIRGRHDGRLTDYGHDACGAAMAVDILRRWQKSPDLIRRVSWLVKTHMKFHYFSNTGQGDLHKWLRREAQQGPFKRTAELMEAVEQATALACADIIGCGRAAAETAGTAEFGRFLADLACQMPVSTRDLAYDRRLPSHCGKLTGNCLKNLLLRVQSNELDNDAETLFQAAEKWLKRQEKAET